MDLIDKELLQSAKTDYVLLEHGYSMHLKIFKNNYELVNEDYNYLKFRTHIWKRNNLDEGFEPLFLDNSGKISGIIIYGKIDFGERNVDFNPKKRRSFYNKQ